MKIIFHSSEGKVLREENLDDAEMAALDTVMVDSLEWATNAIRERARVAIDDIVTRSGLGSKYTEVETKKNIIRELKSSRSALMKPASEREAEFQAKLEATRGTCNPPIDPIIEDPPIDPIKEGETP